MLIALTAACLAGCGASADDTADAPLLAYLDPTGALRVVIATTLEEVRVGGEVELTAPFAWSPNGQLLAASDGVDLWTARPGGRPERLTALEAGERAVDVAWTADGLRVAYQVEGSAPRIEVVDRLSGTVTRAYPRRADLGGWWEPAGLAAPMLVVRERERAVYLVDIATQTRRPIAGADVVRDSRGGAVRFRAGGTEFIWTAFEGATPSHGGASGEDVDSDATSLTVLEEGGVITVVDLETGEERTLGEGTAPALQPVERQAEPPPARERRNLLAAASSFERGTDGWLRTGFNAPVAEVTQEDARYGDSAAEVTFGGEQSVFAIDLGESRTAIDAHEVTFSAWVRTSVPGVQLRHLASNAEPQGGVASEPHPGDGEWHRLTLTFTPQFDIGGVTSYTIVGIRASSTGTALVDGVQLEYGGVATDYEPAADDPLSALPRGEPIPVR